MYTVRPFTSDHFDAAFANDVRVGGSSVADKAHCKYLFEYLSHQDLAAKTIIVENEYIDRDYLEDYTAYYATCFKTMATRCKRVHFFSKLYSAKQVDAIVDASGPESDTTEFRNSYLGFVVVRPLPEAIIGRTQLKTYGADDGRRSFPTIVRCVVHFCGITLEVDTLPFQEQDQAVAKCATVALWSCFQKTADLYQTATPRPPQITKAASQHETERRTFPSSGLSVGQICSAIRHYGLDPEVIPRLDQTSVPILSLAYGYMRAGLPVVLLVKIFTPTLDEPSKFVRHAVAVVGYSMRKDRCGPELVTENTDAVPLMTGQFIDKLYVHDDTTGPFSRFSVKWPRSPGGSVEFESSGWSEGDKPLRIVPEQLIIPAYPKIRLSWGEAYKALNKVRRIAELAVGGAPSGHAGAWPPRWDLHLTTTNDYKAWVRTRVDLFGARKRELLGNGQPRFLWRCSLSTGDGFLRFEMLLDATSLGGLNSSVFTMNFFDENFAENLVQAAQQSPAQELEYRQFRALLVEAVRAQYGPEPKSPAPTKEPEPIIDYDSLPQADEVKDGDSLSNS